jgi:hypothetical protein
MGQETADELSGFDNVIVCERVLAGKLHEPLGCSYHPIVIAQQLLDVLLPKDLDQGRIQSLLLVTEVRPGIMSRLVKQGLGEGLIMTPECLNQVQEHIPHSAVLLSENLRELLRQHSYIPHVGKNPSKQYANPSFAKLRAGVSKGGDPKRHSVSFGNTWAAFSLGYTGLKSGLSLLCQPQ